MLYLPTRSGFVLSTDLLELAYESPLAIRKIQVGEPQVVVTMMGIPDTQWHGSRLLCAANGWAGMFVPDLSRGMVHNKKDPGEVLEMLLLFGDPAVFFETIDLSDVHPFKMVFAQLESLFEAHWDGERVKLTRKDASRHHVWLNADLLSAYERDQLTLKINLALAQEHYPSGATARILHILANPALGKMIDPSTRDFVKTVSAEPTSLWVAADVELLGHAFQYACFKPKDELLLIQQLQLSSHV